jgi:signal transduction histidine kinase
MLPNNRTGSATLTDLVITGAVLVGSLALLNHGRGSNLDLAGGALTAASALPLLVWRRAPLGVFVFTAGAAALAAAAGYALHELWVPLGPTVALYLLAARGGGQKRSSWQLPATTTALLVAYAAASAASERAFPWLAIFHAGLSWAVAWFAGERTRLLHERMAQLEGRALQAQREADQERRLAVAEERARIARDLHDSAGHAINVIAVRAGAARLRHRKEPERSLAALQAIEEVARQTAADIDRIVHALRGHESSGGDPAAPLGLASLQTLVTHHQQAGLDVSVHSRGEPRPLPPSIDQAAYRILQEALTNAARHGGGAVDIEVGFEKTALDLTVTNPVSEAGRPPSRPGHGLIGMRERALMLGGTMDARGGDGSFHVSARIPYTGRED